LTAGDKEGRIIIFKRTITEYGHPDFSYFTEFSSAKNDAIKDPNLRKLPAEITDIEWLSPEIKKNSFLVANACSVKLY
jgi:hypothetical protein